MYTPQFAAASHGSGKVRVLQKQLISLMMSCFIDVSAPPPVGRLVRSGISMDVSTPCKESQEVVYDELGENTIGEFVPTDMCLVELLKSLKRTHFKPNIIRKLLGLWDDLKSLNLVVLY